MAKLKLIFGAVAALGLLAGGTLLSTTLGTDVAHAQSSSKATVDAAIARGEIGEQIDGYLGIVDGQNPSADVRTAMADINIRRKSAYTEAASQGNVQTAVFAQLTGEKQIAKSAPGTYIKDASGRWKKK